MVKSKNSRGHVAPLVTALLKVPNSSACKYWPCVKSSAFASGETRKSVDFVVKDYALPSDDTTYVDFGWNFDDGAIIAILPTRDIDRSLQLAIRGPEVTAIRKCR